MGIKGRVLFLLWVVDPFSLPLHDHLKTAIEFMYERCYEVIGTEKEYNNATAHIHCCTGNIVRLHGLYMLHVLYRLLVPSNIAPDDDVHRSLCTALFRSRLDLTGKILLYINCDCEITCASINMVTAASIYANFNKFIVRLNS